MSADRWPQLTQIVADALQLPADGRAEFAAQACGDDETLRAEAISLLTAAGKSGAFMTVPALDQLARTMATEGARFRPDERVGAYALRRRLGAGGMGEVWLATDERLGREVAIKVLLPHFLSDPDRLRRFSDEARAAGSLNHSNIMAVYDVGEHRGAPFLVTEYLEGESLRKRLDAGPLASSTVVTIALQIAKGLAAAHAREIIHRDLKPDNIFVKSDGTVKILDFGVAKLRVPVDDARQATARQTMSGVIVGTPGYSAPEQVRGEAVDARADLFALGVTMYEMLAGRHPFKAASTIETLHSVLTADPPDLVNLNRPVPAALIAIVGRLLEKSPGARFQSAADLAWALERLSGTTDSLLRQESNAGQSIAPSTRWVRWAIATLAVASLAGVLWWGAQLRAGKTEPSRLTRFTWSLPDGMELGSAPVVSPDNNRIAFVGLSKGVPRLYVRDRASLEPTALSGTEGARQPFWSPDGSTLAFFANGNLMRLAVEGGAPTVICDTGDVRGGTWSPKGTIVFQPDYRDTALVKVRASGGRPEPATVLDITSPDVSHRWPVFLPDGAHFLYLVVSTDDARRGIYLGNIEAEATRPGTRLFDSGSGPVYVPSSSDQPGFVLTATDQWIEARPFDERELKIAGETRKIDLPAAAATPHHSGLLSASSEILAFTASPIPYGNHVATTTRAAGDLKLWPERELTGGFRVSPDGGRLARTRLDALRSNPEVWVDDLVRGSRLRVTNTRDLEVFPVWSPDGRRLAFRSGTNAKPTLNIAAADGSGGLQALKCPRSYCEPTDWATGDVLIVNVSGGDVWGVPLDGSKAPYAILSQSFDERDARLSPDGRWIAYVSEESGPEVSVRSMSGPPRRFAVSSGSGDQPVWRRDGAELFYVDQTRRLHGVSVEPTADGGLKFGLPRPLAVPQFGARHNGTVYDVSPDGERVYFPHPGDARSPRDVGLVLGWRALLR